MKAGAADWTGALLAATWTSIAAEAREYLLGLGLAEEDIATLLEKRFQSP